MMRLRNILAACLLLLAAACGNGNNTVFNGYAEADYLYISAREAGQIVSIEVEEAATIEKGALLTTLDSTRQAAEMDRTAAAYKAALARAADMELGARPEEIEAQEQAVSETAAALALAEENFERVEVLHARGQAPTQRLDEATATLDAAKARHKRAEAELAQARLGARSNALEAAEHEAEAAAADLAAAEDNLQARTLTAPEAGRVERIYRRVGERAGPNEPILALLPPGRLEIRFFVPQAQLSTISLGDEVTVACDGCPESLRARITYIADAPQFTPPVIYSREEREKLVYLIKARAVGTPPLRPGQPLEVRIAP